MIKRLSIVAVATLAVMVIAPAHAEVVTYNAADDFYTTADGSGSPWSYGFRSELLSSTMTPFDNHGVMPAAGGANPADALAGHYFSATTIPPYVMKNVGDTDADLGSTVSDIAPGTLFMHPGDDDYAVVRWTAQTAGILDATAVFARLDSEAGVSTAFLADAENANATVLIGAEDFGIVAIKSKAMEAGDFIDFIVGSAGDFTGDATSLDANVRFAAVPEPATLASMCMALCTFGLITFVRRRKQKA